MLLEGAYRDFDIEQVKKDLKFLYRTFKNKIAKIDEEVDMDKAKNERFYKVKNILNRQS